MLATKPRQMGNSLYCDLSGNIHALMTKRDTATQHARISWACQRTVVSLLSAYLFSRKFEWTNYGSFFYSSFFCIPQESV